MKDYRTSRRALALCLLFAAAIMPPAAAQTDSATYEMTFAGDWTAADITDSSLPGGAHFTSVVGAPHAPGAALWAEGATASPGIENVAELGSTSRLRAEVRANADAGPFISAGSSFIGPTSTVRATFTTSSARPEVSVISMIAPTPDWFVGVSELSLRGADGWRNEISIDLYAWDAGTEDGGGWSLSNPATDPRGVVTYIGNSGKFNGRKLGTLTFERTDKDDPPAPPDPDPEPPPDPETEPPALDETARRFNYLPLVADGEGIQSTLLITNVTDAPNQCGLAFLENQLDAGDFESHDRLRPGGAGATVDLPGLGSHVSIVSRNGPALALDSATLDCAEPAVARVLITLSAGGAAQAAATLPGAGTGENFGFPIMPAALGDYFLIAHNRQSGVADCRIELTAATGGRVEELSLSIPGSTTAIRTLADLTSSAADFAGGSATVSCDRQIAATGLLLGSALSGLPPVLLSGQPSPPPPPPPGDGACRAGLVVNPGESCTYKGHDFTVSSSGRGSILFFASNQGIDARGSTVNGVSWNFHATKNSGSNSWTIQVAD